MSKIEEMRAQFTNIYVKNIDETISQEEFEEMFGKFGAVTSCVLSLDEAGVSRGFGFVNYESHESAAAAVEEMNEKVVKDKQLYVSRAQKKSEREDELRKQYEKIREEKMSKYQGVNLYVKNLDDTIDDEKLRQEFSAYGVITSSKVMRDEKTDISKGFGFVCFSTPEEATKAVTEVNGRMVAGKPIYVALAQRKELRRQQLAVQMQQRALRMPQGPMPPSFPGQPMFYPGPPPQRPGFFPPQMVQQRRWNGPGPMPQMPGMPPQPGMPPYPRPNAPAGRGVPAVGLCFLITSSCCKTAWTWWIQVHC